MMIRSTLLLLLASAPALAAGAIPEPVSYTKPMPGAGLVFVMLGDAAVEAKHGDADVRRKFAELRARYPATGLYRADTAELVWGVEVEGYAHPDWVFLTNDGVYLVRIDGNSWQTKDYASRNRLPEDEELKQLHDPAVSFFKNGKLLKRHPLQNVVTDPGKLPHSPLHVLWMASGVFDADEKRFVLFTQDSNRVTFDVETGSMIVKEPAGLGNPKLPLVLVVVAVLVVALLVALVLYLRQINRARAAAAM